jgi:hypothetical protein
LGHDERALARGAGRYGVDRADADRRRGCGGGGDSGTNGALGCCGIEAWPGRGDQHQQSGLLLADLPPGSVEQVQDLVEDHRLDGDGPAAGPGRSNDRQVHHHQPPLTPLLRQAPATLRDTS